MNPGAQGPVQDGAAARPGRASREDYRSAMSCLPGGVAVVAGRSGGNDILAVVTSVVSISLEEPTIAVVLHADSRIVETMAAPAGWAVTVLGAAQRSIAAWIAEPGRPDIAQLAGVDHRAGDVTGAAILPGAAWLECVTQQQIKVADHVIIVGAVIAAGRGSEPGALVHRLGRVRELTAPGGVTAGAGSASPPLRA